MAPAQGASAQKLNKRQGQKKVGKTQAAKERTDTELIGAEMELSAAPEAVLAHTLDTAHWCRIWNSCQQLQGLINGARACRTRDG